MSEVNITGQRDIQINGDVVGRDKIDSGIKSGDINGSTSVAIGAGATATTNITIVQPLAPNPQPLAPLHQIPPPPPDFTGRARELAELLGKFEQGVALSGVRGQGGIGKTALALKLAQALAPRFPDAQLYVDLRGASDAPLTPAEALAQVIRAYRPEIRLPDSDVELRALYCSVLDGKRALLLLDDAAGREQVAPLVPPASCGLVITSRQSFALPGLHPLALETLPPDDALALLTTIVGMDMGAPVGATGRSPLREIAALCGYLPLALRAAGSLLAETPDLSPAAYAQQLHDERARLELRGLKAEGVEISVEASFTLSYDRLPLETQAVFAALAIFPADFDAAAEEAVCVDPGHKHLSDLVKRSLVSFVPAPSPGGANAPTSLDPASGRYHLHDLARAYAASVTPAKAGAGLAPEARAEAAQRHALYYADVIGTAQQLYSQGHAAVRQGLALFDLEWPNIRAGQAWAAAEVAAQTLKVSETFRVSDEAVQTLKASKTWEVSDVAAQTSQVSETWEVSDVAAQTLKVSKTWEVSDVAAQTLKVSKTWEVSDVAAQTLKVSKTFRVSDEAAQACSNYAWQGSILHLRLHPREYIRWLEAALAAARHLKHRQAEGAHLGNLGLAHAALGETRKAIEYYEQILSVFRELGDQQGEGQTLGNLGLAYADLGETRKAIEYYEQALAIEREMGDRRGEGAALGNLGLVYADLGETRKAIEYHEQALVIDREIGDRRGEANTLMNTGNAYYALGDAHRAIEYHEQVLPIFREIGDRRGEGNALGNLGVAYADLGETHKAIGYYEQRLTIAREIGDRRGEGNALGNLGVAYKKLGETGKAMEYYGQQLTIACEIGDQRGEGNALWNMSLAQDKLGDRAQAISLAEAALKILEQIESPYAERVRQQVEEWQTAGNGLPAA